MHVPHPVRKAQFGVAAAEQPGEKDDAHDAGQEPHRVFCDARRLPFSEHAADGARDAVVHGIEEDAAGEHMDDAEDDLLTHPQLFEEGGDVRDARGDQRERDAAAEVAAGEGAADAAEQEKDGDDHEAHVLAHVPPPIFQCELPALREQVRAEHLVDGGHEIPQAVHEMVEHHQQHAQPAQEVDLPEAIFSPAAITAGHCFVALRARAEDVYSPSPAGGKRRGRRAAPRAASRRRAYRAGRTPPSCASVRE